MEASELDLARPAAIVLEFADPTWFGMDPEAVEATPDMAACASVLGSLVPDPGRCRLVVTGDFIESVRQRSADPYYRDNYSLDRNTGVVGGKTMPMPDGSIDVLLHAMLFTLDKTPGEAESASRQAIRTVLHEGQHVAMRQAGEADPDYSGLPVGRMSLLTVADQVIEEYRAEAGIEHNFDQFQDLGIWNIPEVLTAWLDTLARIACVEYQEHLDVGRLWYGIGQETHTTWKLLAYLVARIPASSDPAAAIDPDVVAHPLWQLMVEPHWSRFAAILRAVPTGMERTSRRVIDDAVEQLAEEFEDWFRTLGFALVDDGDQFAFYITDWTVLETA